MMESSNSNGACPADANLYISPIPEGLTKTELDGSFSMYGDIRKSAVFDGFALCQFSSPDEAQTAISEKNNSFLRGVQLKVSIKTVSRAARRHQINQAFRNPRIVVKNLPDHYTTEQMKELCQNYGEVIRVHRNDQGTGTVQFRSIKGAKAAAETLNDSVTEDHRRLSVKQTWKPHKDRRSHQNGFRNGHNTGKPFYKNGERYRSKQPKSKNKNVTVNVNVNNVYIKGVDLTRLTRDDVITKFMKYGPVTSHKFSDFNLFVRYKNSEHASKAISNLNGAKFHPDSPYALMVKLADTDPAASSFTYCEDYGLTPPPELQAMVPAEYQAPLPPPQNGQEWGYLNTSPPVSPMMGDLIQSNPYIPPPPEGSNAPFFYPLIRDYQSLPPANLPGNMVDFTEVTPDNSIGRFDAYGNYTGPSGPWPYHVPYMNPNVMYYPPQMYQMMTPQYVPSNVYYEQKEEALEAPDVQDKRNQNRTKDKSNEIVESTELKTKENSKQSVENVSNGDVVREISVKGPGDSASLADSEAGSKCIANGNVSHDEKGQDDEERKAHKWQG